MVKQNAFLIQAAWEDSFLMLSDSEVTEITLNLFRFNKGIAPILSTQLTKMFWKSIEHTLILNQKKYEQRVQTESTKSRELLHKNYINKQ